MSIFVVFYVLMALIHCGVLASPITPKPTADSCTEDTLTGSVTCMNPRWASGGPTIDWCIWNDPSQPDCEGGPVLWCAYMGFGPLLNGTVVTRNEPTAYPYGGLGTCPCGSVPVITCSLNCHNAPIPTTGQPQTPSPTLPPNNRPYIRFGNTIPSGNFVDAVISQTTQKYGNISFTWTNYGFANFSGWVEVFENGFGTIDVYENSGGSRGGLLVSSTVPLTPGPLVVVVKDYWPPSVASNIETIAASYAPAVAPNSGVRLFNLSPDTKLAGLEYNGGVLVDNVNYALGSTWSPVQQGVQAAFAAFDSSDSTRVLATVNYAPPAAPFVFTCFLVGLQANGTYAPVIVPLVDAPE